MGLGISSPVGIFARSPFSLANRNISECRMAHTKAEISSQLLNHILPIAPLCKNVGVIRVSWASFQGAGPTYSMFSRVTVAPYGKRNRGKWPKILRGKDLTSLTCARRILLLGGHRLWIYRAVEDPFAPDDWWSLAPRHLWKYWIADPLTVC